MNQKRLVLSFLTLSSLKFTSLKTQQTAKTESFSLNAQVSASQIFSLTPTPADPYMAAGTHLPDQAQPHPDRQGSHHHSKAGCLGNSLPAAVTLHVLKQLETSTKLFAQARCGSPTFPAAEERLVVPTERASPDCNRVLTPSKHRLPGFIALPPHWFPPPPC